MKSLKCLLVKNITSVIFIYILSVSCLFLIGSQYYKDSTYKRVAQDTAIIYSNTLSLLHQYYSDEILPRAKASGAKTSLNYLDNDHDLPFPITFSNAFGQRLNKQLSDVSVEIYSQYPFENRKDRQLNDSQKSALTYFEQGNTEDIFKYEKMDSGEKNMITLITPIYMLKPCLNCHNAMSDYTGITWKDGDFRGVREISFPVSTENIFESDYTCLSVIVALLVSISGVFLVLPLVKQLKISLKQSQSLMSELEFQACHDPLTKISNLNQLTKMMDLALKDSTSNNIGLLFIDLNKFKYINDTWGHAAGDRVLISCAQTLKDMIKTEYTLARIGGDEFVIMIPNIIHDDETEQLASRITKAMTTTVDFNGLDISYSASIGHVVHTKAETSADMLLSAADHEMYKNKNS